MIMIKAYISDLNRILECVRDSDVSCLCVAGMQLLDMDSDSGDQIEHFDVSGMKSATRPKRK